MSRALHLKDRGRADFSCDDGMNFLISPNSGVVCKRKSSPYDRRASRRHDWIKVKNPRYSQLEGREELFERNP